jgi:c-di-GMP-binding flagellar brake protein YcgR
MDSLPQPSTLPELEDDDRYRVYSRTEILAILRGVVDKGCLVTINFNMGTEFVLTSLLHINPEFEELVFDYGPDEARNRRLLQAERMTIVTEHEHIKIQFTAQHAQTTVFEEHPAFRIRLPQSLMRLQRREFFRAAPPASRPILTHLGVAVGAICTKLEVRVVNISCGGVALAVEGQVPDAEIGKVYQALQIQLPEVGAVTSDIEIRNISQFTGRNSKLMTRLGCRFIDLPTAMANMVQRYITKLEISRRQHT